MHPVHDGLIPYAGGTRQGGTQQVGDLSIRDARNPLVWPAETLAGRMLPAIQVLFSWF
jgi:hypothetical protein